MVGFGPWDLFGPGAPEAGAALLRVGAYSVLAAIPLTAVVVSIRHVQANRNGGRPAFSWRAIAGMLLFFGAVMLNISTDQLAGWSHIHRVMALVSLLLVVGGFAFLVAAKSRYRRLGVSRSQVIGPQGEQ